MRSANVCMHVRNCMQINVRRYVSSNPTRYYYD